MESNTPINLDTILKHKLKSTLNDLDNNRKYKEFVQQEKYKWFNEVFEKLKTIYNNPEPLSTELVKDILEEIRINGEEQNNVHKIFKKAMVDTQKLLKSYDTIMEVMAKDSDHAEPYITNRVNQIYEAKKNHQRGSNHERQTKEAILKILETHFPGISKEQLTILENVHIKQLNSIKGQENKGVKLEIDLIAVLNGELLFIGESKANPGAIAGDATKFKNALEKLANEFTSQKSVTLSGKLGGDEIISITLKGDYSCDKLQERSFYFVPSLGKFVNKYTGKHRSIMLNNDEVIDYGLGNGKLGDAVEKIRTCYQQIRNTTEKELKQARSFPIITAKSMVAESLAKSMVSEIINQAKPS